MVEIEAVVDTGFNRFLTLPPGLIAELGLPFLGRSRVTLADGGEVTWNVHEVTALWDGTPRLVDAYEADATPLVGMALMESHDLSVQVREGGRVVIRAAE